VKRSSTAIATIAAFLSLTGCATDPIAPGEERGAVGATEAPVAEWETVRTALGGEACTKTITESIRHNKDDGEIAITWWRAACGNVQCTGRIVGRVDLKEAASEDGSCSNGTRTLPFSDTL
jgi:hypothetical protein